MSDNFFSKIFRARAAARHGRRAAVCANSLLRYAILGAVALSILPASALANFQLQSAQTQDQAGEKTDRPIEINARPLRELLSKVRQSKGDGTLDMSGTFALNIEADRRDDGTFENVSIKGASGDAVLKSLGEQFIQALSESRALSFLEGVRHLRMAFRLDAVKLAFNISTEIESDARASQTASSLNLLLGFARSAKRDKPEGAVFNNMTVSSSGKQLAFRLEMSREAAGNLLFRQITPN